MRRLREHLDDAVDLGAEVLNIEASDLVDGLVDLARRRRVTRLVLPYRASGTLERVRSTPLAERILERLPALEDHDRGRLEELHRRLSRRVEGD